MVLLAPSDPVQTQKMTRAAVSHVGPMAIRVPAPPVPTVYKDNVPFELGKAVPVADGKDVAVISSGMLLSDVLAAVDALEKEGVSVRVLDMPTIKPLDEAAVLQAARETGAVVTVEDSSFIGGLGGAVAELLIENQPVPLKRVGVKDRFGQSGTVPELKEEYELSARHIAQAVKEVVKKKK